MFNSLQAAPHINLRWPISSRNGERVVRQNKSFWLNRFSDRVTRIIRFRGWSWVTIMTCAPLFAEPRRDAGGFRRSKAEKVYARDARESGLRRSADPQVSSSVTFSFKDTETEHRRPVNPTVTYGFGSACEVLFFWRILIGRHPSSLLIDSRRICFPARLFLKVQGRPVSYSCSNFDTARWY